MHAVLSCSGCLLKMQKLKIMILRMYQKTHLFQNFLLGKNPKLFLELMFSHKKLSFVETVSLGKYVCCRHISAGYILSSREAYM